MKRCRIDFPSNRWTTSSWSLFCHSLLCVRLWSSQPACFLPLPLLPFLFLCLLFPLSMLSSPSSSVCQQLYLQLKLCRCVCGNFYLPHIPSALLRTHLINPIKATLVKTKSLSASQPNLYHKTKSLS